MLMSTARHGEMRGFPRNSPLVGGFRFHVVEDRVEVADGLHGLKGDEIGLDPGPLSGIGFGGDGGAGVGVVSDEVVLELGRDGAVGVFGEFGQERRVGLVGERIAAGLDDVAGVEVPVGKIALDGVVVGESKANGFHGTVDALDVEVFGLLCWALYGEELEEANLRENEDEAGVKVAANAGRVAVFFPIVFGCGLGEVFDEGVEVGAGNVGWEVLFVEDGFGAGDVGEEAAGGEAVGADGGLAGADDVGKIEAVGFEEGFAEKEVGDIEANVAKVGGGSEAALAELVDVEGELGLDVGVGVLGVIDRGAVTLFEAGELDGDGEVDGGAVADGVADVVGEGADGEGEFVGGLGVAEEREDEVAGADVVGEVREELVAEGIVAEVLDGAAAVGKAVGFLKLGFGEIGEAFEEDGTDGRLPGEVDEFFVGLDGVGGARCGREKEGQESDRLDEGRAA
jgi:hypothetical protein